MHYLEEYKKWLKSTRLEPMYAGELSSLTDKDIEDRFYRSLDFGTAGLRGVLGAGTNRMNLHTVRQATKGLSDYINSLNAAEQGVVIAYDSRNMSREFAQATAQVLCYNGIKTYLFSQLHPVPMLSFAVRYLHCVAGIVITASHNPPEYNGYKVYWSDGGQITPDMCKPITERIAQTDVLDVDYMPLEDAIERGILTMLNDEVDEAYYTYTMGLSQRKDLDFCQKNNVRVVYTPLHGSGLVPVTTLLERQGYDIHVVEEQRLPDGNFPTVSAPNPESRAAFDLAVNIAKELNADLAIATDPDSDRMGVCIRNQEGEYTHLTGNTIGTLLLNYILEAQKEKNALPKDAFAVKSIVSTKLADKICAYYGVEIRNVLTGFRYIAEQIDKSEKSGVGSFLFGFEESYGYLAGTSVRDKDACLASMLMGAACAYYKSRGLTIMDALNQIEQRFGAYIEKCLSFNASGKDGMTKLTAFMKKHNDEPLQRIAGFPVLRCENYISSITIDNMTGEKSPIEIPKANVIIYDLGDDNWVCIRPSGTEPKFKVYIGVHGKSRDEAEEKLFLLDEELRQLRIQ